MNRVTREFIPLRVTSIRISDVTKEEIGRTADQVRRATGLKITESEIMRSALDRGLQAMSEEFAT